MYARNRSPETWELKRKWRNIATRERRKAIKDYWAQKSSELKTRPRNFFKTFNPFLSSKSKDTTNISIQVNDSITSDQKMLWKNLKTTSQQWQMKSEASMFFNLVKKISTRI